MKRPSVRFGESPLPIRGDCGMISARRIPCRDVVPMLPGLTQSLIRVSLAVALLWPVGGSCCCSQRASLNSGTCAAQPVSQTLRPCCAARRARSAASTAVAPGRTIQRESTCHCRHQEAVAWTATRKQSVPDVSVAMLTIPTLLTKSDLPCEAGPLGRFKGKPPLRSSERCAQLCRWLT